MADLTTTAAAKAYAGVTDSGDDAAIGGIVSAVSVLIHGLVGHDYDGASIVGEVHSGPVSGAIVLAQPAATIDEVREGTTTLSVSAYVLDGAHLLYRKSQNNTVAWEAGRRNIQVDYTTTSTVPADLELAAREVAAYVIKQSGLTTGANRLGLSGQANADAGTADYFQQALRKLPIAGLTLRRYQRFS